MIDLGIPIIHSDLIPEGHAYLFHPEHPTRFVDHPPIKIQEEVWAPSPLMFSREAKQERWIGLDHVAGLLDDLCERWGMDPDEVWRQPRLRRRDRLRWAYRMEERIGLMVNPPLSAAKIVVAP